MKNKKQNHNRIRINEGIRAPELRVIDEGKGNLGVISTKDALQAARDQGLDLIEISPNATPPVAKIMDYGKYQYDEKKKQKAAKARSTGTVEVKEVQIKIGTGEQDLMLKAKRASAWLGEGHRVKVELYLRGRAKYVLEKDFLRGRIDRFLKLLTEPYEVVEELKKVPKGWALIVERSKKKKAEAEPKQEKAENSES